MDKEQQNARFFQQVMNICMTAGQLMIEGGSEMYRVEDTMMRIATNSGVKDARVFATPTGVFISLDNGNYSSLKQVRERNINLELVDRVNDLSRKFADQTISLDELDQRLEQVVKQTPTFPLWLQVVGAGILSATLMVMFIDEYDWIDFPIAGIIGAGGYLLFAFFKKSTKVKFLSEMLAAMMMGLLAIGFKQIIPQINIDHVLIGALMTLVPGLALTNALRDLFSGDLLSGIARAVEAILTAIALGGGVGIVIKFFGV